MISLMLQVEFLEKAFYNAIFFYYLPFIFGNAVLYLSKILDSCILFSKYSETIFKSLLISHKYLLNILLCARQC